MSRKLTTSRAKIRTFAQDLEIERQKQGHNQPQPTPSTERAVPSKSPEPTPKPKIEKPKKPEKKIVHEKPIKVAGKKMPAPEKKTPKAAPIIITTPKKDPAPEKPKSPFSSTPIPAFHEAQKKNHSEVKKTNIGYDATVITDNKQKQFKLFPSIIASVQAWFKKATTKKKETPKYTVPDTKHRKGVIQKATTKTGAIFTADSDTIKEQIRKRRIKERDAETQETELEVEADEPETIWSPYTDSGYALLEDGELDEVDTTQNASVEYKQISNSPAVEAAPPEPVEEVEESSTDEPETTSEEDLAEARWSKPEVAVAEPEPEPDPVPLESEESEISTEEVEGVAAPEKTKAQDDNKLIHQFDTNTLTIVLLVMVVGFITILLISKVVIGHLNEPEPTVSYVAPSNNESVLKGAQVVDLTITNENLASLPSLINSSVANAPIGLVEMTFVSPIGEEISPSYLFELLRFRTSPPLRQSVTTARVVTVNNSEPAMLFHFIEEETMRGEMLSWESVLVEDFKRLYGLPEIGVSDFVDTTIGDIEVRAASVDEKIILLYGFIGPNTILFTTNRADFAQITQLNTSD